MDLTEAQERNIGGYVRAVSERLSDLPESERRRALTHIRATIERRLAGMTPLEDASVDRAIAACGAPDEVASHLRRFVEGGQAAHPPRTVSPDDRVWLGVCAYVADRLRTNPLMVRLILCALALILPITPLLLVLYLGAYIAIAHSPEGANLPRPAYWPMAKSVAIALVVGIAMHVGFGFLLSLPQRIAFHFLDQAVPVDPEWAWLEARRGAAVFWAMAYALPLAALAEAPVPNAWRETLRKLWQAALAIYAVVLCFGVAAHVVGLIMTLAEGLSENPAVSDFFTL